MCEHNRYPSNQCSAVDCGRDALVASRSAILGGEERERERERGAPEVYYEVALVLLLIYLIVALIKKWAHMHCAISSPVRGECNPPVTPVTTPPLL